MIRRTLLEWQRLDYGDGDRAIPAWAADRLAAVAPHGALAHGRRDLRAQGHVGVIAAEGCALEILPKIDGLEAEGAVRRRLVHMLAVALDIQLDVGRVTGLGWQRDTLLEILIGLFARKLADAVRLGLPRRYVGQEDDLPALRGRLDATRQFTTLAASPQRLACRFDDLSFDIALNRIMKAVVAKLSRLSRAADNQRLLRELAFAYADVSAVPSAALRFDDVVLDRTNARWRDLVELARLLLGNRFQTTSGGAAQGHALLFEMNLLFEEYIARSLAKALVPAGLRVKRQGGRRFCLTEIVDEGEGKGRFQTIPDILVQGPDGRTRLVIDTKWKRLGKRVDDPKQGVAQADVYQMIAYGRLYECDALMLLYPWHRDLAEREGITSRFRVTRGAERLAIATVDISRDREVGHWLADVCLSDSPFRGGDAS